VASQFYIRMRGRVLGPYDQEKLQSLAKRGQLSRMHELSVDATNWVRASTYPELFVVDELLITAASPQGPAEPHDGVQRQAQPPAPTSRRWWYRKNGAETGPVDETALQQMLAAGNVGPDDLVWTDGMGQWAPARNAPGLLPVQSAPWLQEGWRGPVGARAEEKNGLSASLCKAASNSRFWVVFIAVIAFVYAALAILTGIFALVQGANQHLPPVVAGGLFALILAVDVAAGGFLLTTYASRVANLKHDNHEIGLEKALDTLRTFWVYISINLIVYLAFLVFVVVWAIAVGATFPWQ
jgi:hypothetical protein